MDDIESIKSTLLYRVVTWTDNDGISVSIDMPLDEANDAAALISETLPDYAHCFCEPSN